MGKLQFDVSKVLFPLTKQGNWHYLRPEHDFQIFQKLQFLKCRLNMDQGLSS